MDFSAIVLWIVKNDPFAFLSLTKIRNIFKNPKSCKFWQIICYNFNYIKIRKNIKRKNNMTPHYSSRVWEFLVKYCKIIVF